MAIQGLRTTANFVTNQRPENWREALMLLYPNSAEAAKAPLTALTSLMKSESTDDPVFHWWEKALDNRRLRFGADATDSATSLTVDSTYKSALIVKAGDLLLVEQTGEIVRVASDPASATALTVTRAVAGTTGAAVNYDGAGVNPYLQVIGSAFEEGSVAPTGVNYDPNEKSNYTQIFRSTLEITRTASKTRLRTGDAVKEAKRECLEYISIDMERAFWLGRKHATTLNGKPIRYTDGIKRQITVGGNVEAAPNAGVIDTDYIDELMLRVFTYGSSEKMVFGSNTVLAALNKAVKKLGTWNVQAGNKEYGMAVTRFTSPFGELVFKNHPLFNQMVGGLNPVGGGAFLAEANNMYILDMSGMRYRYFSGDDLRYEKDLTPIGLDGMKSGYIAECGIELHHTQSHYLVTGITGAAADD